MGDSDLKNKKDCAIKFSYRSDKTTAERVKLMNEAYKNKCFSEFAIFRWHGT